MLKRRLFLMVGLLLVMLLVWTRNMNRPYIGHHDWDNVLWFSAAENHDRYGIEETRLQQILNTIETSAENWSINQRHPPGISLITYGGISIFGHSEFASRVLPFMASLISVALLYALARRLYDDVHAELAVFLFGFTPLMAYYNTKIGHEQFTLPLILLTMLMIVGNRRRGLLIIGFAGCFISWAWFLFIAIMGLFILWRDGWQRVRWLRGLWIGGLLGGISLLALMAWQQGDFLQNLMRAFEDRTAGSSDDTITLLQWIAVVLPTFFWIPTPVVTIFGWIGLQRERRTRRLVRRQRAILWVPTLVTLIYVTVFWEATFFHDYLIFYLVAVLCIWASAGFRHVLLLYGRNQFWRGIMGFLLVLFLVGSARWTYSLHTEDYNEQRQTWGLAAAAVTEPHEEIVTNLPNIGPHVSHYADRVMLFEREENEVIVDDRPIVWGFYIFCVGRDDPAPDWLSDFEYEFDTVARCYLVDLNP